MKKVSLAMLIVVMVFGFSTAAKAATVLTFDIDFYGGDTTLAKGVLDTGTTIDLQVGDTVKADLLYSITEVGLWKAGWDVRFPADNLTASNPILPAIGAWTPYPDDPQGITPGHVKFRGQTQDAWAFTGLGPGSNLLLGTFELTCTGVSLDEIWLYDYNPNGPDWAAGIVYGGGILDSLVVPTKLASINNNPVPVPGAVWLLGSGLTGLVALRRRRMKN
jgi:hypothetical protein